VDTYRVTTSRGRCRECDGGKGICKNEECKNRKAHDSRCVSVINEGQPEVGYVRMVFIYTRARATLENLIGFQPAHGLVLQAVKYNARILRNSHDIS